MKNYIYSMARSKERIVSLSNSPWRYWISLHWKASNEKKKNQKIEIQSDFIFTLNFYYSQDSKSSLRIFGSFQLNLKKKMQNSWKISFLLLQNSGIKIFVGHLFEKCPIQEKIRLFPENWWETCVFSFIYEYLCIFILSRCYCNISANQFRLSNKPKILASISIFNGVTGTLRHLGKVFNNRYLFIYFSLYN